MVKLPVVVVSGGLMTPFMESVIEFWEGMVVTEDEALRLVIVMELLPELKLQVGLGLRLLPNSEAQLADEGGVIVEGKVIWIIPVEDRGLLILIEKM